MPITEVSRSSGAWPKPYLSIRKKKYLSFSFLLFPQTRCYQTKGLSECEFIGDPLYATMINSISDRGLATDWCVFVCVFSSLWYRIQNFSHDSKRRDKTRRGSWEETVLINALIKHTLSKWCNLWAVAGRRVVWISDQKTEIKWEVKSYI